jgi:hypothetical protein
MKKKLMLLCLMNYLPHSYAVVEVVEAKDGTISVASAFPGHQEGTILINFHLLSLILNALQHRLFPVIGGLFKKIYLFML